MNLKTCDRFFCDQWNQMVTVHRYLLVLRKPFDGSRYPMAICNSLSRKKVFSVVLLNVLNVGPDQTESNVAPRFLASHFLATTESLL